MRSEDEGQGIPTLGVALMDLNSEMLKRFGDIFSRWRKDLPTRKADLVGFLLRQVEGGGLRALWAREVKANLFRIDRQSLVAAIAERRTVREIRDFLSSRAGTPLPDQADALLREVEDGARSLKDAGLACLVECADPQIASRLATHASTRKLCLRAGAHHVAVPATHEQAFARAVRKLGLPWPTTP